MADSLAYNAEKILRDQAERIAPDLKTEVEGKIAALRSALTSAGIDQIRSAMNELSESMQKIGAAAYGQAGAEPPGGEGGEGGEEGGQAPPEEGTVEGEYREV
jgi:molecular chaperone DnaK